MSNGDVYVVCAEVPWDSYHKCILVTLDKAEAEKKVRKANKKHEKGCRTQRKTWSDYDECFCKRLHMHEMPLRGVPPEMSDLTIPRRPATVEDMRESA